MNDHFSRAGSFVLKEILTPKTLKLSVLDIVSRGPWAAFHPRLRGQKRIIDTTTNLIFFSVLMLSPLLTDNTTHGYTLRNAGHHHQLAGFALLAKDSEVTKTELVLFTLSLYPSQVRGPLPLWVSSSAAGCLWLFAH